jgi:hypothetical protein
MLPHQVGCGAVYAVQSGAQICEGGMSAGRGKTRTGAIFEHHRALGDDGLADYYLSIGYDWGRFSGSGFVCAYRWTPRTLCFFFHDASCFGVFIKR